MIEVKFLEDSDFPPYHDSKFVFVILDENGKIYSTDNDENPFQHVRGSWRIPINLSSQTINDTMMNICDLINMFLKNHSIEEIETSEYIFDNVMRITDDLKDMQVKIYTDIDDLLDEYECPSEVFMYLRLKIYSDDNAYIECSPSEGFEQRMRKFVEDVDLSDYYSTISTITEIYNSYNRNDQFANDFWTDFIPELMKTTKLITVENDKLYYNNTEITFD